MKTILVGLSAVFIGTMGSATAAITVEIPWELSGVTSNEVFVGANVTSTNELASVTASVESKTVNLSYCDPNWCSDGVDFEGNFDLTTIAPGKRVLTVTATDILGESGTASMEFFYNPGGSALVSLEVSGIANPAIHAKASCLPGFACTTLRFSTAYCLAGIADGWCSPEYLWDDSDAWQREIVQTTYGAAFDGEITLPPTEYSRQYLLLEATDAEGNLGRTAVPMAVVPQLPALGAVAAIDGVIVAASASKIAYRKDDSLFLLDRPTNSVKQIPQSWSSLAKESVKITSTGVYYIAGGIGRHQRVDASDPDMVGPNQHTTLISDNRRFVAFVNDTGLVVFNAETADVVSYPGEFSPPYTTNGLYQQDGTYVDDLGDDGRVLLVKRQSWEEITSPQYSYAIGDAGPLTFIPLEPIGYLGPMQFSQNGLWYSGFEPEAHGVSDVWYSPLWTDFELVNGMSTPLGPKHRGQDPIARDGYLFYEKESITNDLRTFVRRPDGAHQQSSVLPQDFWATYVSVGDSGAAVWSAMDLFPDNYRFSRYVSFADDAPGAVHLFDRNEGAVFFDEGKFWMFTEHLLFEYGVPNSETLSMSGIPNDDEEPDGNVPGDKDLEPQPAGGCATGSSSTAWLGFAMCLLLAMRRSVRAT